MPGMFIGICPGEGWGAGDCAGDDGGLAGIFIPGMLPISSLFAGGFFRVTFFFLRVVAFDFGFGFGLLIPGMLWPSCCARTGRFATNRKAARTSNQTLILKRKLIASMFFIIPLENSYAPKKSFDKKTSSPENSRFDYLVKTSGRVSVIRSETPWRGLDQKNTNENMSGRICAGWRMLSW